ncbi:DUF2927 domain-containing protein [bacterium SCSIO 12827]|nr:DUF2927 domain-containing protein [bacterium SCSIO 12827]
MNFSALRPLIFLMAICLTTPSLATERNDVISREDALVRLFEESVFKGWTWPIASNNQKPFKIEIAVKWQAPLNIWIMHEIGFGYPLSWEDDYENFRAFIATLLLELSQLTGLPITEYPPTEGPDLNAAVYIIGEDYIETYYENFNRAGLARLGTQSFVCSGWPQPNEAGTLSRGYMLLRTDLPKNLAQHCIVKTMLEALGLSGIGGRQQVSRDRIDGHPLYPLSLEVKLILRTLYDPRIKHDMARADAMAQARTIIGGLLRAIDRQGESALYQH